MKQTRRHFLVNGSSRALVLTTLPLAITSTGVTAVTADSPGPQAPWLLAGTDLGDARLNALSHGILAPNPHNRQPWIFELRGDSEVMVYCDLERRLPETDPFDRQIVIGFGCMLELTRLAAASAGYRVEIQTFPEGAGQTRLDARSVALLNFRRDSSVNADPLAARMLERRTTRSVFQETPVALSTLEALVGGVGSVPGIGIDGTVDQQQVSRLTRIAADAWNAEYTHGPTRRESIDLMRIGSKAVASSPDGVALDGFLIEVARLLKIITPLKLDTPGTMAYEQGLSVYGAAIESARGFVWLHGDNTRASQLAAGAAWVRLNLAAQNLGVAIHPLSQALQEFDAVSGQYAALHKALAVDAPQRLHMFARIGYARFDDPSPRWPLETRMQSNA